MYFLGLEKVLKKQEVWYIWAYKFRFILDSGINSGIVFDKKTFSHIHAKSRSNS